MQDIKPFEPVVLKQSNLMDIIKRAQGQQSASSAATQQPPELRLPAQQQLEQSAVPQPAQLLLLPSLLHLPLLKLPRLLPRGQLLQLLLLLPSVLHLPLLRLPRLLPRGQLLQLLLLLPSVLHLPLLRLPRLLPREQLLLLPSVLHLPLLRLPRGQLLQLLLLLPSVLHLPLLRLPRLLPSGHLLILLLLPGVLHLPLLRLPRLLPTTASTRASAEHWAAATAVQTRADYQGPATAAYSDSQAKASMSGWWHCCPGGRQSRSRRGSEGESKRASHQE